MTIAAPAVGNPSPASALNATSPNASRSKGLPSGFPLGTSVTAMLSCPQETWDGQTFKASITVENQGTSPSHFTRAELTLTGGLRIANSASTSYSHYFGALFPGQKEIASFWVVAPPYASNAQVSGTVFSSDNPDGDGTMTATFVWPCDTTVTVPVRYNVMALIASTLGGPVAATITVEDSAGNQAGSGSGEPEFAGDPVRITVRLPAGKYRIVVSAAVDTTGGTIKALGDACIEVVGDAAVSIWVRAVRDVPIRCQVA